MFEVWATNQGIEHWLRVPSQYEQVIVPPLLALVPGTRLVPDDEYPSRTWTQAVEVGVKNSHRQLQIADASALSANILARFAHLGKDETLMMQWAITPAAPRHKPSSRRGEDQRVQVGQSRTRRPASHERRGS